MSRWWPLIRSLILCLAIALWGWQTQFGFVAIPAALMVMLPHWVPTRWDLTTRQLYRVSDFCILSSLGLAAIFWLTQGSPRFILLWAQWLAVMLFPLTLAHLWTSKDQLSSEVLFWNLRDRPHAQPWGVDVRFFNVVLWLLGAGAVHSRNPWFYAGLVVIAAGSVVAMQPQRGRMKARLVAIASAAALGFGIQYGLNQAQQSLQDWVPGWLSGSGSAVDPYRSATDIGHIGALKNSDSILLRINPQSGAQPPRLLHRASYNRYLGTQWYARRQDFVPVPVGSQWKLQDPGESPRLVTIHDFSSLRNPVLSLPAGSALIEHLSAQGMRRNPMGAVQIEREPGYFSYRVTYDESQFIEAPPNDDDLQLHPAERSAIEQVLGSIALQGLTDAQIVERVQSHFAQGFRYSLFQGRSAAGMTPVADFLLRSKAGHCEYFATATALLLRAAGIPARYATGFAVLEHSDLEGAWVVRTRHAHAWVRAYVGGRWISVDTTPPTWATEEQEAASNVWSIFSDGWSWVHFRLAGLWARLEMPERGVVLWGATLPLLLGVAFYFYRHRQPRSVQAGGELSGPAHLAGADSEFYALHAELVKRGLGRQTHEGLGDWLARLRRETHGDIAELEAIVQWHQRYRFDPLGLNPQERMQLAEAVRDWMKRGAAGQ